MRVSYLECTRCGEHLPADRPQNICPKDGGVLFVRYDLASLKGKLRPEDLSGRVASMWRYAEVLPELCAGENPVTLGEGFTPMLPSREFANVYIKDEGLNPTGSFKALGKLRADHFFALLLRRIAFKGEAHGFCLRDFSTDR